MLTQCILAKVEPGRLQTAVEGFVSGAYTITPTRQTETEISGFVTNSEGPQYRVVLTGTCAFCSCPDAMFRHTVCKHAVVLALHVIRSPKGEQAVQRPVNLKLGKMRSIWQVGA